MQRTEESSPKCEKLLERQAEVRLGGASKRGSKVFGLFLEGMEIRLSLKQHWYFVAFLKLGFIIF